MTTLHWAPAAIAVQQVEAGSIDSVDGTPANNTFTVTIGNVSISQVGDTDVATTAAALVALLNASTHPYFNRITWTNPSAGDIVGTADNAGEPFVATLTETGAGTGAVTDFATSTANDGPNVFDSPDNWREGAAPSSSDELVFANSTIPCRWGLEQTSLTGLVLYTDDTFEGEIGLNPDAVQTDAAGSTVDTAAPEYRTAELAADFATIEVGRRRAGVEGDGSPMIRLHNSRSSGSTCRVQSTGTGGARDAFEYSAVHASATLEIREALGGVGVCTSSTRPTGTLGTIEESGGNAATKVAIGAGVTFGPYVQRGGTGKIAPAATLGSATAYGGTLTITGSSTVTALFAYGGDVRVNGAQTVTAATVNFAGVLDLSKSSATRTLTLVTLVWGTYVRGRNATVTSLVAPGSTGIPGHTVVATPP